MALHRLWSLNFFAFPMFRPAFQPPIRTPIHQRFSVPLKRWLAAALLTSCGLASAQGITVAIGGGLEDDNAAVWSRLVDLAGGAGARFTVFATASGHPERTAAGIASNLARFGAQAEVVEIAPHLPGIDLAAAVSDPRWVEAVRRSRGVFFSGGAQARLVDTLQPDGEPTPVLRAVQAMWDAGGVVAGTSAGAAVMSRRMFRNAPDVLAVMKGRLREGREVDNGFGLLPPDVIVDQHSVRRGRIARLLPMLQAEHLPLGIGVAEDSAIVVQGQQVEVIGSRGALFVDISGASSNATLGAFNVSDARLHWLEAGDRFDLSTRSVTPTARKKTALQLRPALDDAPDRQARAGAFFRDILDDGAIVRAMTRRLESGVGDVLGLAFDDQPGTGDPDPELGFEWWLRAGPGTRGFRAGDALTLIDLRLDVVPVRLARLPYTRVLR
jgi:cyanophycinase